MVAALGAEMVARGRPASTFDLPADSSLPLTEVSVPGHTHPGPRAQAHVHGQAHDHDHGQAQAHGQAHDHDHVHELSKDNLYG